jgi:hypothetical protein
MNDGKDAVLKLHNAKGEAIESFQRAFIDYARSEKWMGAVWRVKDDGNVELFRTTWEFPKNKFVMAIAELNEAVNAEKAWGVLPAEPLPRASIFRGIEEGATCVPISLPTSAEEAENKETPPSLADINDANLMEGIE